MNECKSLPGDDWTTQTEDPNALFRALGAREVKRRADAGDKAAQFSLGRQLVSQVAGPDGTGLLGAGGRSPKVP